MDNGEGSPCRACVSLRDTPKALQTPCDEEPPKPPHGSAAEGAGFDGVFVLLVEIGERGHCLWGSSSVRPLLSVRASGRASRVPDLRS